MDEAIKKVRRLAASAMARREKVEAELSALVAEKQRREAERELALSAEDDAVALKLTELIEDLNLRSEQKRGELVDAEAAYGDIVRDLRAVQDAAKEHERLVERAPVEALRGGDPFHRTAEDAALENVRHHIETLSAQADLGDELGASRERKFEPLTREEAEAKAKAQLAELKAKRKQSHQPDGEEQEPPKKPKKTM